MHVDEIAAACPERMEAMVFGVADYAASLQSHTTSIGGSTPAYSVRTDDGAHHWGDHWHYPLASVAVACRVHGLRPIDGPYGDFGHPEAYCTAARRAAVLGYDGKWAIHPSQVVLALASEDDGPRDPAAVAVGLSGVAHDLHGLEYASAGRCARLCAIVHGSTRLPRVTSGVRAAR
jgi:hypothetical protein